MFNYLLPAKTGELSYLYLANRRLGVSVGESGMNLLVARFFDLATIALFLPAVMAAFWERLPSGMVCAFLVYCGLILVLGLGFLRFLQHSTPNKTASPMPENRWLAWVQRVWRDLVQGLHMLVRRGQYWRLGIVTVAIWLCVYSNFYFIVLSLGYNLNYLQMVVISTIMVPFTLLPVQGLANLGSHEAGWLAALTLLGQPPEAALTISIGSHTILLFFFLFLGGLGTLLGIGHKARTPL
jgi:uncharacterized membrane protein YbhN (UPF0104 family)